MSETEENITQSLPKYSIVLRFWSTPQEIEATNIVLCEDKYTKQVTYKFIDSIGRIWYDVPFSDVIVIKNYPDKDDIDNFAHLEHEPSIISKQPRILENKIDVSVG